MYLSFILIIISFGINRKVQNEYLSLLSWKYNFNSFIESDYFSVLISKWKTLLCNNTVGSSFILITLLEWKSIIFWKSIYIQIGKSWNFVITDSYNFSRLDFPPLAFSKANQQKQSTLKEDRSGFFICRRWVTAAPSENPQKM